MYNFDEIINRKNTNSVKWDGLEESFGLKGDDYLPMWVADMDFMTSPEILEELRSVVDSGLLGYSIENVKYKEAIANWLENQHNYKIDKSWIIPGTSLITSLKLAINVFTNKGDKVLVQTPVYPQFFNAITENNCELVDNKLVIINNRYEIDFIDFEKKLKEGVKAFILCSPHNPVGRVWTKDELRKMAVLCNKYSVMVISDEIHFDLSFGEIKHTVYTDVCDESKNNALVLTSPHKTFNIAGLNISNAIIPDEKTRILFEKGLEKIGSNEQNRFGQYALLGAYNRSELWLEELKIYLGNNRKLIEVFLNDNLPKVKIIKQDGLFLGWLDFRAYKLTEEIIQKSLFEEGRVVLNAGSTFGDSGKGFFRINFACPKEVLIDGLKRIVKAMDRIND